jgi:integrase
MANKAVALIWYCKTESGWRRFPALVSSNGKVRTGVVMVDGEEQKHSDGRFLLRSFAGGKLIYTSLPENISPSDALSERNRLARRLAARISAHDAGTQIVETPGRVVLRTAAAKYVQRAKDSGAAEAAVTYAKALEHFQEAMDDAGIRYVDEVNEEAMLRFHGHLRQMGNGARTVFNKNRSIKGFLLWAGADKKTLGTRKPTYEKTIPRVYSRDEVSSLLGAADEYMGVVLDVLRMAGLREQEAAFLQWQDVDLKAGMLHVRSKPAEGFTIKDKEQRDIPMPAELIATLKGWKKKRKDAAWVLGTRNDKPNTKLLLHMKWTARRAGLNCGRCDGCKARKECEQFTLHSWRRTYATRLAQGGMDARSIMALMGHSDIQTTMRYLAPMDTKARKKLVDAVTW